jgi:hypothetical protein
VGWLLLLSGAGWTPGSAARPHPPPVEAAAPESSPTLAVPSWTPRPTETQTATPSPTPTPQPTNRPALAGVDDFPDDHSGQIVEQLHWASIVAGEAGYGWPDGARLVAWTMQAWRWYRGIPVEDFGPETGWYAYAAPTKEYLRIVQSVWRRNPTSAPYPFMQAGGYCVLLGSLNDVRVFQSRGWVTEPEVILWNPAPAYDPMALNCFLEFK